MLPEYRRGTIGLNEASDEINLHVLREQLDLWKRNGIELKLGDPIVTEIIPTIVFKAAFPTNLGVDNSKEFISDLLRAGEENVLVNELIEALKSPDKYAFRAFTRSHWVKERYRQLGLDYDRDVVEENLKKFGGEYDPIWCKEPHYCFSIGNLFALHYFTPSLWYDPLLQEADKDGVLATTASSYLSIYEAEGFEKINNYHSYVVADGVPLAHKRIATIRVDWKLPNGVVLPNGYGQK